MYLQREIFTNSSVNDFNVSLEAVAGRDFGRTVQKPKMKSFTTIVKRFVAKLSILDVSEARPATLLKKRLWHRCFPVDFVKFLRTPFLYHTSGGCF